jgi:hypothetical protein
MFATTRAFGTWNTRFANKPAFTSISQSGYHQGLIHGVSFHAHHVIWALHYGEWAPDHIDHINGRSTDNRITNLRTATHDENMKNLKLPKTNKSGYIGVYWDSQQSKWRAQIRVSGKQLSLGSYDLLELAVAVRIEANIQYGYHENHGKR